MWILDIAFEESQDAFNRAQNEHIRLQFHELAKQDDPTHSSVLSLCRIDDFYELRDKGGVLGSVNARIFYGVDNARRALVVLGALKKESDRQLPSGDKIRIGRRWRKYQAGDFGLPGGAS